MLFKQAREKTVAVSQPTKQVLEAGGVEEDAEPEDTIYELNEDSNIPSNEVPEWWNTENTTTNNACPESEANTQGDEYISENGALRMYWLDAVEIRDRKGKLYLIGKVKDEASGNFKSCCVTVNNLQRYMYVVPKVAEGYSSLIEMPQEELNQVWLQCHEELQRILVPRIITDRRDQQCFSTKLVDRMYAFEETNIPLGKSKYLKLKYAAKFDPPPQQVCDEGGKHFERICGSNTKAVELFLIRRRLLGPCWIEIQNAKPIKPMNSYCNLEYVIDDPKYVSAIQGLTSPPLTVMSLSLKTFCNPTTHHHEVVALSSIIQQKVNCEGAMQGSKAFTHFTAIRPIEGTFPPAYVNQAKNDQRFASGDNLRIEINERALLNYFLTRVQREDPDVIVGHNIHKYELDVLLSRMDNFKLGGQWSKLTRLRRGRLQPYKQGEGWSEYRMDDIANGRLICDTYVAAKELLSSQPTYSLSHLVNTQLNRERHQVDIVDIPQILTSGPKNFVDLCRHTSDDALFVLHLMHKLEVLPLTKQLANLCGYFWNKTLEANKRAERIEYLLLHEFNRKGLKYVVPDKQFGSKVKAKSKDKESYAGGMVFAPKKGLYDSLVVILDFNSLYPSIIREYNICFTTVDRSVQDDEVPPLPSSNTEGVLPGVIERLLKSRKQVKKELKDEQQKGNAEKVKRLDIRQKAIKLTANSMYGCLGFRHSRFYAKPIAALITATGRQTLQRAKEVAENECGYDVIYGDTDSIMVDSRTLDVSEAKKIGYDIQTKCNKKFKLLNLEMENIFQRILLLNKKKYAALVVKEQADRSSILKKEVKGLDLVRRDWCILSKKAGNDILDFILSNKTRDEIVEAIHDYLQQLGQRVRDGKEPLEQFVITKSLNKNPEQYPDKAKQYHVQVALAMKAFGQPIGAGAHIPYVICKEEEPGSGRRAYHPDEVQRAEGRLTLDLNWYLEAQIHPPINRLCAHIDGTSSPQLAHCLGLDANKFSHAAILGAEEEEIQITSVLQNDSERFHQCEKLQLLCVKCNTTQEFPGVYQETSSMQYKSGLFCPNCASEFWGRETAGINGEPGDNFYALVSNVLALLIRQCTAKYYQGMLHCNEPTCQQRTKQISLRVISGTSCLQPGCHGTMLMDYSDSQLYLQLKYLQSLFDPIRATEKLQKLHQHRTSQTQSATVHVPQLIPRHQAILEQLQAQMEHVIRRNEYNWVQPSIWNTIFT